MRTILIIDDEEDIIELTKMAFEARGYHVLKAYDGKSGLKIAQNQNPDLILLDIMMPGIDGIKVCQLIKANTQTKKIPVLMLSAKAQPSDIESGKRAGCDDYVIKPFEMNELISKIGSYLN